MLVLRLLTICTQPPPPARFKQTPGDVIGKGAAGGEGQRAKASLVTRLRAAARDQDPIGGSWHTYMEVKNAKLAEQFEAEAETRVKLGIAPVRTRIFEGVSIYVNGIDRCLGQRVHAVAGPIIHHLELACV